MFNEIIIYSRQKVREVEIIYKKRSFGKGSARFLIQGYLVEHKTEKRLIG